MKKIALVLYFIISLGFASPAAIPEPEFKIYVMALHDNIQMFRQASTAAELVQTLKKRDEVLVVRQHNKDWTIVVFNDLVGYVLTTELSIGKNVRKVAVTHSAQVL